MPVQVTLNLEPLKRAFSDTVQDFAAECQGAFDDPLWAWPATTRRRNGEVVGSPRNLVDLGELKRSQRPAEISGNHASILWDSDHAAAVFLGAVFKKRRGEEIRRTMPARNLPLYTARSFNWAASYAKHFR